jgi:hypothetical protein
MPLVMHDALAEELTTTNYCCRACTFMQIATVKSIGYGAGYFGSASRNAREDAKRAVSMLLALVRCPRCGRRDEAVVKTNKRARTLAPIAVAVTFALFAALFYGAEMEWGAILLAVVGVMTLVWIRHAMVLRYPLEITDQVTFSDLPQPAWTPVAEPAGAWKWI